MSPPQAHPLTIGVFDSGVGGLSILKALRQAMPSVDLRYVADSGNAPYGNKPKAFIEGRVQAIADYLIRSGVQMIVVACNTATVVAVEQLRAGCPVPVVAMEPAIKPAVAQTRTGVVGVLATERTLESPAVAKLCQQFEPQSKILLQPCPGWVELVERGELSSPQTREALLTFIQPLLDQGADTLVLGCTHYVFLAPEIEKLVGPGVKVIEPSAAVARQSLRMLAHNSADLPANRQGREVFMTTGDPVQAEPLFSQLWGRQVTVSALDAGAGR